MANVKRELQAMVKVSEHGNVVKVEDVDWKAEWPKSDGSKKVSGGGFRRVCVVCRRLFLTLDRTGPAPLPPPRTSSCW